MRGSETGPDEQDQPQAGAPEDAGAPGFELVCPQCRLRLECFAELCPACGADLGDQFTLTYRPPTSALARGIALAALIAIGLLLLAVVAALLLV